jgi:hypothetical protein
VNSLVVNSQQRVGKIILKGLNVAEAPALETTPIAAGSGTSSSCQIKVHYHIAPTEDPSAHLLVTAVDSGDFTRRIHLGRFYAVPQGGSPSEVWHEAIVPFGRLAGYKVQ